jgi:hypothetical protein
VILPAARPLVALVAGLTVLALTSGCGASNCKGVIEGKWKFVGEHANDPKLRDASLFFDGSGVATLEQPGTGVIRPEVVQQTGWHYKLSAGDTVDFYDLPSDANDRLGLFRTDNGLLRVTIKIELTRGPKYEGREMTLTDADGQVFRLIWLGSPWGG